MNRLPDLDDKEFYGTLLNALTTAADKFAENAKILRADDSDPKKTGHYRWLADQFETQERETRALIEKLEEGTVDV